MRAVHRERLKMKRELLKLPIAAAMLHVPYQCYMLYYNVVFPALGVLINTSWRYLSCTNLGRNVPFPSIYIRTLRALIPA